MIIDIEGDILLSKASAIAHNIAPNDDFHSGLALELRQRWPGMYKDFRHFCHTTHPKTGSLWAWKGPGSPVIYNLMCQEAAYGQGGRPGKATIEAVHHALTALRKECEREKHPTLALSRLATGVGGLDRPSVKQIIEKEFKASDLRVYVYSTYRPGVAAVEA